LIHYQSFELISSRTIWMKQGKMLTSMHWIYLANQLQVQVISKADILMLLDSAWPWTLKLWCFEGEWVRLFVAEAYQKWFKSLRRHLISLKTVLGLFHTDTSTCC